MQKLMFPFWADAAEQSRRARHGIALDPAAQAQERAGPPGLDRPARQDVAEVGGEPVVLGLRGGLVGVRVQKRLDLGDLAIVRSVRSWALQHTLGQSWTQIGRSPAGALVASSSPHLVWLHAERQAIMPPFEADPLEELRLLDAVPVDYAIVDGLSFLDVTRRYAEPALKSRPDLWEPVRHDPGGSLTIYRRRSGVR